MSDSPLCTDTSFHRSGLSSGKAEYHSTDVGIISDEMSCATIDGENISTNNNDNGTYNAISPAGRSSQYNLYEMFMNPLNLTQAQSFRYDLVDNSLPEVHGSIAVPEGEDASWYRMMLTFVGPGVMVAVGYMDVSTKLTYCCFVYLFICLFSEHFTFIYVCSNIENIIKIFINCIGMVHTAW